MEKYVNKLMAIRLVAFISLISSGLLYAPKPQSRDEIHEVVDLPFVMPRTHGAVVQPGASSIYLEPVIGGNPYDIGFASEVVEDYEDQPLPPPPVPAKQSQSSDDVGPALPPKSPTRNERKSTTKTKVAVSPILQDPTYSPVVPAMQSQHKNNGHTLVSVQAWLPGADGRSASVSSVDWDAKMYDIEQSKADKTVYVDPQDMYSPPQNIKNNKTIQDAVAARFDGTGVAAAHQETWSEDVYDVTAGALGTDDHTYTYLERPTGHAYMDFGQEDPYTIATEGIDRVVASSKAFDGNDDLYAVHIESVKEVGEPVAPSDESSTDQAVKTADVSFEDIMGSTDDFDEENPYLSHTQAIQIVQKSENPLLIRLKNFWETTFKKSERIGFADFVTLVECLKPFESADTISDQSFQKELESGIQKTKMYIGLLPLRELLRQENMFARDNQIRSSVMAILKDDPKKYPFFKDEIGRYVLEKNHLAFLSDKYIKAEAGSSKNVIPLLIAYIDQAALCITKLHHTRVAVLCSEIKHRVEKIIRDYNAKKIDKAASIKAIQELLKAAGKKDICRNMINDTLQKQSPKLYKSIPLQSQPKKPWWKKLF